MSDPSDAPAASDAVLQSLSAAGTDGIPVTVVEEAPGDPGPHSKEFERKRDADAQPDMVITSEGEVKDVADSSKVTGMGV